MSLLFNLKSHKPPATAGNKALNLYRLSRAGVQIPRTFVCDSKAYLRYVANDISLADDLLGELKRNLRPDTCYAVRSSANIEDGTDHSYAGQFRTVLNVQGVESILQAIRSVWDSAQTPEVTAYLKSHALPVQHLVMAVILQEMVQAEVSGVVLSRNPVTGADEVVVEAVQGLGVSLVQDGVTPHRWVNKWGSWLVRPQSNSIPSSLIDEVVRTTRDVARRFRFPVDMEWAYDGRNLYFLQMRAITALNRHNIYSNQISKEMLPGIIKPLISTINIPMVGAVWVRLMNELIGGTSVKPEELARTFYYRVYFNMGVIGRLFEEVGMPADSVELMMNVLPDGAGKPAMRPTLKTIRNVPTMLRFAIEKWNFARPMRRALPQLQEQLSTFNYQSAADFPAEKLISEEQRLYEVLQDVVYYNKVGQVLMGMFNLGLKKQLAKTGVDFKDFDLMEEYGDSMEFDPNNSIRELHIQFQSLNTDQQEQIRKATYQEFMRMEGLGQFQAGISAFLERFGYLSDNGNDFSFTPWRESPDMVKQLITDFIPEKKDAGRKIRFSEVKKNPWMHALYVRARDFCFLRDQVSSMYTFGYGLFRYYYLALGNILVCRGWIDDAGDIYYLTRPEVREAICSAEPLMDYRRIIQQHKADIERYRNIQLPTVIYGDVPPPIQDSSQERLVGIPTSIGHYTGRVVCVRGNQDFAKVKQGDVLVIPYSDVSWTPLFTRAGAVVSEAGGLLSHSSIVAREYNIPAIVSAECAMSLPDQTLVTVNGHTGEVIIHAVEPVPAVKTSAPQGVHYAGS
ncbi:MAG: PEP/pyruvate-binding domain-containing protein [Bacteroidota bacterium]